MKTRIEELEDMLVIVGSGLAAVTTDLEAQGAPKSITEGLWLVLDRAELLLRKSARYARAARASA